MQLWQVIDEDIKTSMKNKEVNKLKVLRMVKGAILLEKINKKEELDDSEVIAIISKQIKMRKDSINEFQKASRSDLIEEYQSEINILQEYLPEALTEEELNKIIDEEINNQKAKDIKAMGLIMRAISSKVKGRADMSHVSQLIKQKLEDAN